MAEADLNHHATVQQSCRYSALHAPATKNTSKGFQKTGGPFLLLPPLNASFGQPVSKLDPRLAPCAPGKWSPSQIVELVARGFEEDANMAAGRASKGR